MTTKCNPKRLRLVKSAQAKQPHRCPCPAGHQLAVTELIVRRSSDGEVLRRLRPVPGGFAEEVA